MCTFFILLYFIVHIHTYVYIYNKKCAHCSKGYFSPLLVLLSDTIPVYPLLFLHVLLCETRPELYQFKRPSVVLCGIWEKKSYKDNSEFCEKDLNLRENKMSRGNKIQIWGKNRILRKKKGNLSKKIELREKNLEFWDIFFEFWEKMSNFSKEANVRKKRQIWEKKIELREKSQIIVSLVF